MNRLSGKVVVVTGAARGQGRSHAVHLADEGADVIVFDICADIETNEYPLVTEADLQETKELVKKSGRRAIAAKVVVYPASDESRYVTGQQLFVDAGASLKMGL
jgi:NAD(P)-dependent dehydrogenase (short-subunit alcohol dehydrogenase family)